MWSLLKPYSSLIAYYGHQNLKYHNDSIWSNPKPWLDTLIIYFGRQIQSTKFDTNDFLHPHEPVTWQFIVSTTQVMCQWRRLTVLDIDHIVVM